MKVFITGGTGLIGAYLSGHFLKKGCSVTATGSRSQPRAYNFPKYQYISTDTRYPGKWQESVQDADLVINLAGKSIFKRWNQAYKRQIVDSRILTTRHLVAALPPGRAVSLFSASAVGYYGNRGDERVTEKEPPGDDFLARLGQDWETEALAAENAGHRVVLMRLGVVLGKGGGAFRQMAAVFKRFAGGPLGSGRQWFPWIHIADLAGAIDYIAGRPQFTGPFNFCAPNPLRNRDVAKTFGQILKRPAGLKTPSFVLRLLLGEFADILLGGQQAVPDRLVQNGFVFRFPQLDAALANLVI